VGNTGERSHISEASGRAVCRRDEEKVRFAVAEVLPVQFHNARDGETAVQEKGKSARLNN
jgi:hypothetical protein